ncbi:MAG TPA: enoyl-CoA hydratase-related protein [Candidatus Thermoplasmatota archaeon]|nr:enoyl-CoA hydratase-related protein [Candidatus Thermoplasmatota archaeon]
METSSPPPSGPPLVTSSLDTRGVAVITLNRPEALNALTSRVLGELESTVTGLRGKARALIVTGAGSKAFVAGADIAEMAAFGPKEAAAFSRRGQATFQALADFPGPVVAAVNGYALGGGLELALACDLIVAAESALLGLPETTLGVVPGFGGTQRLPRRVGAGTAKRLIMTGERMRADEALRLGLVDRVAPPDALMDEVRKLVDACLANGPLAVVRAKRLVEEGLERPLAAALEMEADAFGALFATEDQKEGMKAFLEKRKALFRNG